MAKKTRATIGVDIGGTKTLLALFDRNFRPIAHRKIKTHPEKSGKHFKRELLAAVGELRRESRKASLEIVAVGAGCAGRVDGGGRTLAASPNIPFLKGFPLADVLHRAVRAPVRLFNDVQAGLVGEHAFGAARGAANAVGVFLGTGIGGALIINNRLYVGSTGTAGEIGRYLTDPMGPLSRSERHGTLDDVCNRLAIAGEAAILASKQWAPALYKRAGSSVEKITSEALADAIHEGDKSVEDLARSRARFLGIVMANLANFLGPDVIVLGGGLVEAMPRIFVNEADASMRPYLTDVVARRVRVKAAKLGKLAIAAGAAKMAIDGEGK